MLAFIRELLGIEPKKTIEIDLSTYYCVMFENKNDFYVSVEFLEKGDYRPLMHPIPPGISCRCCKPETVELRDIQNVSCIQTGEYCVETFDCLCIQKKN